MLLLSGVCPKSGKSFMSGRGRRGFFEVSLQKTVKSCIDQVALFGRGLDGWGLTFGYRPSVEWAGVKVTMVYGWFDLKSGSLCFTSPETRSYRGSRDDFFLVYNKG